MNTKIHFLQEVMNSPPEEEILIQHQLFVQIIGISKIKEKTKIIINDGKFYYPAFVQQKSFKFELFQIVSFEKFYIHVTNNYSFLTLINIKSISNMTQCIGSPRMLTNISHLSSLHKIQQIDSNLKIVSFSNLVPNIKNCTICGRVQDIITQKGYVKLCDKEKQLLYVDATYFEPSFITKNFHFDEVYLITNFEYFSSSETEIKRIYINSKTQIQPIEDDLTVYLETNQLIGLNYQNQSHYSCQSFKAIIVNVGPIQYNSNFSMNKKKVDIISRVVLIADDSYATIQLILVGSYALIVSNHDEGHVILIKNQKVTKKEGCKYIIVGLDLCQEDLTEKKSDTHCICKYQQNTIRKDCLLKSHDDKKDKSEDEKFSPILKILDDSHPLANNLIEWYKLNKSKIGDFVHMSNLRKYTLAEMKSENLGQSKDEDFFIVEATLKSIEQRGTFYKLAKKKSKDKKSNKNDKNPYQSQMIQISINNGHRIIPVSWNQYDSDTEFDDQRKSYVGYNKHDEEILYKFDVIFADDTCEGECFMINPEKQGAYEIIMNETAEKWRINELNLTKEQIDQALQEKCNIKYSLEVKAYSKTEEYNSITFYEIQNIYPIE